MGIFDKLTAPVWSINPIEQCYANAGKFYFWFDNFSAQIYNWTGEKRESYSIDSIKMLFHF